MGGRKRKALEQIVSWFDLPSEVMLQLPQLMLLGNQRLHVGNHQGLAGYTDSQIRLKWSGGWIQITGEGLRLEQVGQQEAMVVGRIDTVEMVRGTDRHA